MIADDLSGTDWLFSDCEVDQWDNVPQEDSNKIIP